MKKVILALSTFVLLATASMSMYAQVDKKDDKEKPTTIDAWRQAMPQNEINPNDVVVDQTQSTDDKKNTESEAEIENIIAALERRLAAARIKGDKGTLSYLLADDFVPVGEMFDKTQTDKLTYINWVAENPIFSSHKLEKITVRVYGTTAIAMINYKKPKENDVSVNEDFVVTNIWVKNGDVWQTVSHHISRSPKS